MSDLEARVGLLRGRIGDANRALAEAETNLEAALAALEPVLVGDKRMSSVALDRSFEKLKIARQLVAELERTLATELALPQG